MSDIRSFAHALRRLRAEQVPFLVATVVSVSGSSYRRAGARMIIGEDGTVTGGISAGCLEAALLRTAWWRTRASDAVLVKYDSTSDEDELGWGSGFGCNGVVEVLLEREHAASDAALDFIAETVTQEKRGCLLTVFRSSLPDVSVGSRVTMTEEGALAFHGGLGSLLGEGELAAARQVIATGNARTLVLTRGQGVLEVLAEPVIPPPRLFICGEGPHAVPLARYAHDVGWSVVIWTSQPRWLSRERFYGLGELATGTAGDLRAAVDASARPVVTILSHHYERDRELLDAVLGSKTSYIGILGPRARGLRLLMDAAAENDAALVRGRVHAGVGLDVGAETPQEIALAAMAEIQTALKGSSQERPAEGRGRLHHDYFRPFDHQLRKATSDTWNAQAIHEATSRIAAAQTR